MAVVGIAARDRYDRLAVRNSPATKPRFVRLSNAFAMLHRGFRYVSNRAISGRLQSPREPFLKFEVLLNFKGLGLTVEGRCRARGLAQRDRDYCGTRSRHRIGH